MKTLTFSEVYELKLIVSAVLEIMEPDEILSENQNEVVYSDGGRFLYNMTEKELHNIKRILK